MKNILFILAISSIYCGVFAQKNFIPNPSFENQPIDRDVYDNIESDDNDLIAAREVRVMLTNSPDYVFEDDYCLDELENVAEFIKTNKHLPGVLPAKEIEENGGFKIGAFQLMTLEKLYLHVIRLNERIKALELGY